MTKTLVANMARHHPLVMTVTITTVTITTVIIMTVTITTGMGTRAINALFVTTHTIFMRSVSRADKWTNF